MQNENALFPKIKISQNAKWKRAIFVDKVYVMLTITENLAAVEVKSN